MRQNRHDCEIIITQVVREYVLHKQDEPGEDTTSGIADLPLGEGHHDLDVLGEAEDLFVNERVYVLNQRSTGIVETSDIHPDIVFLRVWIFDEHRNESHRRHPRVPNIESLNSLSDINDLACVRPRLPIPQLHHVLMRRHLQRFRSFEQRIKQCGLAAARQAKAKDESAALDLLFEHRVGWSQRVVQVLQRAQFVCHQVAIVRISLRVRVHHFSFDKDI